MTNRYTLGKVISVGSSSEGNAYYLEIYRKGYPTPFRLLIECGFEYGELSRRLLNYQISINKINAILVTHQHHDHSLAVPKLAEYGKKIFAPQEVFEHWGLLDNVSPMGKISQRQIFHAKAPKLIADGIKVYPIPLEHKNSDGSDCVNFGYIIEVDGDNGKYTIFFATDTHMISYNLRSFRFNAVFIEANNRAYVIKHALENAKKKGDGVSVSRFDRVLRSHMLVENTATTLIGDKKKDIPGFDLSKTDFIYLTHMSASTPISEQNIKHYVIDKLRNARKFRVENGRELPIVKVFLKNGEQS